MVIRMLSGMVEYGHSIEEKVKAMQNKIKKKYREPTVKGRNLGQKEEINIQPEQNEETRIQKSEERPRNLWDNFKCFSIRIIGCQKEKRKSKKLKT